MIKSRKKFVLARLVLLAIVLVLPLMGCPVNSDNGPPAPPPKTDEEVIKKPTTGSGGNTKTTTETETATNTGTATATYTVTFKSNGGSTVPEQKVESGKTVSRPPDPTKEGAVFAGWYTSKDDGATLSATVYNFGTQVVQSLTLYAAWTLPVPGTVVRESLTIQGQSLPKTGEVQVISRAVSFASLYKAESKSTVFVENRKGTIEPFVMGQYPVTQQLYQAVTGANNPSGFISDVAAGETQEQRPVEQVNWFDAVTFCNKLSVLMGLEPVYRKDGETDTSKWVPYDGSLSSYNNWNAITCDLTKNGYRLPTAAEWELAARGGDPSKAEWNYTYAGSNDVDAVAWYSDNSGRKTHQVGKKSANSLHLYDMSGNVWEWCQDWHSSITVDTPSGGAASGDEGTRVFRGGAYWRFAAFSTVFEVAHYYPHIVSKSLGFRVVRSSAPSAP